MITVIEAKVIWYQQLKGKVAEEILAITDGRGKSGWEYVHEKNLNYFVRNCLEMPWTNHLALNLVVRALSGSDFKTIRNSIASINPRFKDLFAYFDLSTMDDFNPNEHIYQYLTKKVVETDSDSKRKEFLVWYTGSYRVVENWLRTKCDDSTRSKLMPYLLPSFSYLARELGVMRDSRDQAHQTRKNETDAIVPLYPNIRAEAHLRWNQLKRLRDQYLGVVKEVQTKGLSLPVSFNYDDKDLTDTKVKYVDQLHFRLWDKRSFVLAHQDQFAASSIQAAKKQTGAYSVEQNELFLEFVKAIPLKASKDENEELEALWFLELLKEGVLGLYSLTKDTELRESKKQFLLQWGYGDEEKEGSYPVPFLSRVSGVITTPKFISVNQGKSEGIIFSLEPLYVAATFGLTAIDLITTTGARINEVLQIANTKSCIIVTNATDEKKRPIKRYLFRVIPKGRTEEENYYMSEETMKLISRLVKMLQEHYPDGKISRIPYQGDRGVLSEKEAPYLFQYNGNGLSKEGVTACMRFLLHGMIFHDQEGDSVTIKAHLLRHAFANHLHQAQKMPIDIIAKIMHQKDVSVTNYYAEATDSQVALKTHELHQIMATFIDLDSSVLRSGEVLEKAIEEAKQKVGIFSQVVGGVCSVDAICPVKMACVGCGGKVPTPEKKQDLIEYKQWAEHSLEFFDRTNKPLEVRKMKVALRNADKELYEIELIEQYRRDEEYEPELRIKSNV